MRHTLSISNPRRYAIQRDLCPIRQGHSRRRIPHTNGKAYSIPLFRVMLVRDQTIDSPRTIICNSKDASQFLESYFAHLDREHFVVVGLTSKHTIIGTHPVSIGSLSESVVHPREVFKPLILMNAAAAILSHNHPSGDPAPSQEDRALTKRLKQIGDLHGIAILDHLIIGDDCYYSFTDQGMLN